MIDRLVVITKLGDLDLRGVSIDIDVNKISPLASQEVDGTTRVLNTIEYDFGPLAQPIPDGYAFISFLFLPTLNKPDQRIAVLNSLLMIGLSQAGFQIISQEKVIGINMQVFNRSQRLGIGLFFSLILSR